jgi:hypothetical protein
LDDDVSGIDRSHNKRKRYNIMMFLLDAFHMAMLISGVMAIYLYAHRSEWKQEEEVNYNIDVWEG